MAAEKTGKSAIAMAFAMRRHALRQKMGRGETLEVDESLPEQTPDPARDAFLSEDMEPESPGLIDTETDIRAKTASALSALRKRRA